MTSTVNNGPTLSLCGPGPLRVQSTYTPSRAMQDQSNLPSFVQSLTQDSRPSPKIALPTSIQDYSHTTAANVVTQPNQSIYAKVGPLFDSFHHILYLRVTFISVSRMFYPQNPHSIRGISLSDQKDWSRPSQGSPFPCDTSVGQRHHRSPSAALELSYTT